MPQGKMYCEIDYGAFANAPAEPEPPPKIPHKFKVADRVYVKGIDKTDTMYGASIDMLNLVGRVCKITEVDPHDGAVILGQEGNYAFHHEDLLSEKDAIKKGLVVKKALAYVNIDAPKEWNQAFAFNGALSGEACSIYYLLYRPKRGEVAKRPTYKQLSKRAKEQRRTAYRFCPDSGWARQVELKDHELVFPYDCWEASLDVCFAELRQQPKYFQQPKYWNGKPPTWFFYDVRPQLVNGAGRLRMWEMIAYYELLMKFGLAPPDICLKQFEKEKAVTFRLKKYGMTHLFGMLLAMRYVHEYPSVPRQTLYFTQLGFNFYVAFILAHKFGGRGHGAHSMLSTYSWDGYERQPHAILREAWKVEQYYLKDAKKEVPFVEKTSIDSFMLQSTIAATKIGEVPVIKTWQELAKQKPLIWKPKTKK